MRLKYKKFIILFTLAIMFIGMATFSMLAPSMDFSFGKGLGGDESKGATASAVSGMSDSEIKDDITALVSNYLDAKQRVDMDAITNCVSDISRVDEKRLVTEAQYVEAYKNVECTIKDAAQKGTYRVYVYYEVKVYSIDELIPSLTALYVTATADGNFQIYLGSIDGESQKKIDELDESDDVKALVDSVQKKLEDLLSSNADVKEFYQMLESSEENDESEDDTEGIENEGSSATSAPQN